VMILADNRTVMGEAELAFEHIFELQARLERMNRELAERTDYESEEYFQKVASYINKKMDELSAMPGYSRQPMETKHTLISLNITDDYFKAKKQAEVFEQDLQQKDQEMYDLKHELISLRMQIEEAQKHEQEALEQKSLLEGKNKELEKQIDELLK